MSEKPSMPEKIVIAGAGICGLSTAMTLARPGRSITITERDQAPPAGDADEAFFNWDRRGAAQFRHPHAFLGLMCNLIQDHHPKLMEEFVSAGARKMLFKDMIPAPLRNNYKPLPSDDQLWILMCRRATMETVMRRYVERLPGITIRSGCKITGLLADTREDQIYTKGLKTEHGDIEAGIVIDASGRTSKFAGWLNELGASIGAEHDDAEIVYYTRHYRLEQGQEEPARGDRSGAGDLGYLKFGVFPGDNGHFAIIICLPLAESAFRQAVRDGDGFNTICRNIPGLRPWLAEGKSYATTEPFGIGDIVASWKHFVHDGKADVLNFFAVGDSAFRTNPLYGRGCSTGILHAHILAGVIDSIEDPYQRAMRFDHLTEQELRPIFDASLREDKNGIKRAAAVRQGKLLDRPETVRASLSLAIRDAVRAASRKELDVVRGAMRTFNLLEKPGAFMKEWRIWLIILRYLLRGRKKNASVRLQPGPDRSTMHELLGLTAD